MMVEGLGLAGQAELPVVVVMAQRSGPSTGMPTYTAQTDLHFVLHAGHGEFPRLVVAPGDADEAYYWAGVAMNKAWYYQMPAFILVDRTVCLNMYSFDSQSVPELEDEPPILWQGPGRYQRYQKPRMVFRLWPFPLCPDRRSKPTVMFMMNMEWLVRTRPLPKALWIRAS